MRGHHGACPRGAMIVNYLAPPHTQRPMRARRRASLSPRSHRDQNPLFAGVRCQSWPHRREAGGGLVCYRACMSASGQSSLHWGEPSGGVVDRGKRMTGSQSHFHGDKHRGERARRQRRGLWNSRQQSWRLGDRESIFAFGTGGVASTQIQTVSPTHERRRRSRLPCRPARPGRVARWRRTCRRTPALTTAIANSTASRL